MKIEKGVKDTLKFNKLQSLKTTYYNLYLDKIALEVAGDTKGAEVMADRMEHVSNVYKAIEVLDTNQDV